MKNDVSTQNWGMAAITILCCESMEEWEGGSQMGVAEIQKMSPSTTGRCYQTREWGQPTNGSAARRHGSQSHGFAVRVWSTVCICSPGVVELVRSNLAPDFPLFHVVSTEL